MAPSTNSRQLLVWTLPTIAVLLSYLWYKKRRVNIEIDKNKNCEIINNKELHNIEKHKEINIPGQQQQTPDQSPTRLFSRSLSGVNSPPIDIVIPSKLKSSKSNPVVISDEELDLEIEKIKSMKYGNSIDTRKNQEEIKKQSSSSSSSSTASSTTTTPKKLNNSPKQEEKKSPTPKQDQEITVATITTTTNNNINNNSNNKGIEEELTKSPVKMAQKIEPKNQQKPPTPPAVKNNQKKNKNKEKQINEDLQKLNGGRDSANHSPADAMLASPSLSCISDNHSEGSNDSGKGGSELNTPPPSRTPGTEDQTTDNMLTIYQFVIPQILVGRLIGKNGSVVHMIKERTGANIIVKKHPTNNKMKLCIVDGTQKEINSALKIIRDKFPIKRFPEVTLENVNFAPEVTTIPLIADHLYLKLVEGINNDTILSCMVTPNHLFVQQPTHPSFPNLNILTGYMDACYSETDSPLLPTPIPPNTVCAAFSVDHWLRATILSTDLESDTSYVKFLDYGGFAYVPNSNLRQIRGDFMLLPFQAAECFLACVKPIGDDDVWPQGAYDLIGNITKGTIIYTQVVDYTEDGIPLVYCYLVIGNQLVFLNQELVNQGFAEWISMEASVESLQNDIENTGMAAVASSSSSSTCNSNSNYVTTATEAQV